MSLWERLVAILESIVHPVLESFSPDPDATGPEIRKNGVVCFLIGTASFVLGASLLLFTPQAGLAPAPFILVAYSLIGVGAYRVVMGQSADSENYPGGLSPVRVVIAVAAICVVFLVYFTLLRVAKNLLG